MQYRIVLVHKASGLEIGRTSLMPLEQAKDRCKANNDLLPEGSLHEYQMKLEPKG